MVAAAAVVRGQLEFPLLAHLVMLLAALVVLAFVQPSMHNEYFTVVAVVAVVLLVVVLVLLALMLAMVEVMELLALMLLPTMVVAVVVMETHLPLVLAALAS
jgi:hypothetical protein